MVRKHLRVHQKNSQKTPQAADKGHMEILATALQGLNSAEAKVEQAATRISQAGTPQGSSGDTVDLAAAIVSLAVGKEEYMANLKALQTGEDLTKHTIDILA